MIDQIIFDGVGNAGTAVARGLMELPWPTEKRPMLRLNDFGVWKRKHAEAGLVDLTEVGIPKAQSIASYLQAEGWPRNCLAAWQGDVRDSPRGAYRNSLTLALTDSHATKNGSVLKARQAGSASLALGLGSGDAIVECFQAEGPGYCCIHGAEPSWSRRLPCLSTRVSTTQLAWRACPEIVRNCGRAAAEIIMEYVDTGILAGGWGIHFHEGGDDRFSFGLDTNCMGPHDPPFVADDDLSVLRLAATPDEWLLDDLLNRLGPGAYYADRELAWAWHCSRCGTCAERVHTIHPAAYCGACGARMQAGLERASGLTAAELTELHHGPVRLTDIGLAEETLLRCATSTGTVVWIHLEAIP